VVRKDQADRLKVSGGWVKAAPSETWVTVEPHLQAFDWAPGKSSQFHRNGESEFVIYKDAPIDIQEVVPASQYCAAPVGP